MAKKTNLGSAKRFGVRYGRRNKEKVALLEKEYNKRQKCPFCNYVKVERLSKGIWQCVKCNAKFAGKAYTFEVPKKKEAAQSRIDAIPDLPEETEVKEEEMLDEQEDIDNEEPMTSESDSMDQEDESKAEV